MAEDLLEARLRELVSLVDWPPTPDLARMVSARIQAAPAAQPWWRRRQVGFALAAALLLATALAAFPPSREAIAGWLGLRQVVIKRVQVLPSPIPTGRIDGDRTPVTLAEARAQAPFKVVVPSDPAEAIFIVTGPPGGEIQFQLRGGVLVTEAQGSFNAQFLFKAIGPGTNVDSVKVNGQAGAWIHGAPHAVAYLDRSGNFRLETLRIAGDVLIWEQAGVVIRVEGATSQAEALRIASGLR